MEQQCDQETDGENRWRENVAFEQQEKQPAYQQRQQQAEQPGRGISNEPGNPVKKPCQAQVRTIALGHMANLTRKSEEDIGLAACIITRKIELVPAQSDTGIQFVGNGVHLGAE